ncbi:hypothetical protein DLAC_11603 [Tieghemostelium lacteum]|uniref:Oxidoreductase-like domain-containing protein n=1 Tax=Tieghemostelium lacteum TaxID=361077 RepID=A0A151ZKR2_TIELA|nr:hypothetical protein DLAC_11603 [Tieghemostelium lacteum]|eukprot:KYQ94490.1 hypothetical protein DLAC_11603 [Tieghemostelium lacteum]
MLKVFRSTSDTKMLFKRFYCKITNEKDLSDITKNSQVLPKQPEPPTNCCQNSCKECVFDVYFRELEEYNKKCKELNPNGFSEVVPLTTDENEDPMQFFMKMGMYKNISIVLHCLFLPLF